MCIRDSDERIGYYGELVALEAQRIGLNSCWVAATYRKKRLAADIGPDETCPCVLAVGYGAHPGKPHATKPLEKLCRSDENPAPDWFVAGVRAAQLAPTAMNRQRFLIELREKTVDVSSLGGPYAAIDLGIVKRLSLIHIYALIADRIGEDECADGDFYQEVDDAERGRKRSGKRKIRRAGAQIDESEHDG